MTVVLGMTLTAVLAFLAGVLVERFVFNKKDL